MLTRLHHYLAPTCLWVLTLSLADSGHALVSYSLGNEPIKGLDAPKGSLALINLESRVASLHGPSAGESDYLYHCDSTEEFNQALELFGAIVSPAPQLGRVLAGKVYIPGNDKNLVLLVYDATAEVDRPFSWDAPEERVDWGFSLWSPGSFYRQWHVPRGKFRSQYSLNNRPVPPPTITVYAGEPGPIEWDKVKVPETVRVIDKRLAAVPEDTSEGGIVRGRIFDISSHGVIGGAEVRLMKSNPPKAWDEVAKTRTDESGGFVFKEIPKGEYKILAEAEGFAGRNLGRFQNRSGHSYQQRDAFLSRTGQLIGYLVDPSGDGIPGIEMEAKDLIGMDGIAYESSRPIVVETDEKGRFVFDALPIGSASVRCTASMLHQVDSLNAHFPVGQPPREESVEVKIVAEGTGRVIGSVTSPGGEKPAGEVHVRLEPEGGAKVGMWSGSSRLKVDGTFAFYSVPPGKYVLDAAPNPEPEGKASDSIDVEVREGRIIEVDITLK